jgi:hypothetical protein
MSKQIAIKEVLNLDFFDYVTKEPLFRLDYCENSSITVDAERLDVRGGQGNYRLLSFDHTKTALANVEASILDLSLLGKLAGSEYTVATVNVPKREVLKSASNIVVLASTPVTGTLKVNLLVDDRDIGTKYDLAATPTTSEYKITGKTITLGGTVADGTEFVVHYDYEAPSTGTITVTADKFAPYFKVVGLGLGTDLVTGESNVPVVFELLKAKPQNSINLTMMSTDMSKMMFELDLFSEIVNDEPVYFTMKRLA